MISLSNNSITFVRWAKSVMAGLILRHSFCWQVRNWIRLACAHRLNYHGVYAYFNGSPTQPFQHPHDPQRSMRLHFDHCNNYSDVKRNGASANHQRDFKFNKIKPAQKKRSLALSECYVSNYQGTMDSPHILPVKRKKLHAMMSQCVGFITAWRTHSTTKTQSWPGHWLNHGYQIQLVILYWLQTRVLLISILYLGIAKPTGSFNKILLGR